MSRVDFDSAEWTSHIQVGVASGWTADWDLRAGVGRVRLRCINHRLQSDCWMELNLSGPWGAGRKADRLLSLAGDESETLPPTGRHCSFLLVQRWFLCNEEDFYYNPGLVEIKSRLFSLKIRFFGTWFFGQTIQNNGVLVSCVRIIMQSVLNSIEQTLLVARKHPKVRLNRILLTRLSKSPADRKRGDCHCICIILSTQWYGRDVP